MGVIVLAKVDGKTFDEAVLRQWLDGCGGPRGARRDGDVCSRHRHGTQFAGALVPVGLVLFGGALGHIWPGTNGPAAAPIMTMLGALIHESRSVWRRARTGCPKGPTRRNILFAQLFHAQTNDDFAGIVRAVAWGRVSWRLEEFSGDGALARI